MTSKSYGTISFKSQYYFFDSWQLETWNSFCITADTEARLYKTFINGKEVLALLDYEGTHQKRKGNIFLLNASYKTSDFVHPMEVGPVNIFCFQCWPVQGSVTDVHIWDTYSDQATVLAWTDCEQEDGEAGGNILNWDTADIRVERLREEEVTRRTVCTQESPRYVAFGTKRNFLDSQHFCKTLSGDMAVATGPEAARNIKLAVEDIEDNEGGISLTSKLSYQYIIVIIGREYNYRL